jgi:RHS repeat-associated protein
MVKSYNTIGNHTLHAANDVSNAYEHNSLNQCSAVFDPAEPTATRYEPGYHIDGCMATDWEWDFEYDAADRLSSVVPTFPEDGSMRVLNEYDYRNRRIRKIVQRLTVTLPSPPSPPIENHTWDTIETRSFVYDDWNLIHETIYTIDGGTTNTTEVQYFWGLDLSDTLHGAGGVGGLLALSSNGQFYFPTYDNNGNVTKYIDESGNVVAAYEYDDFGKLISQSGPLADFFRIRFSTKYFDPETGLYYYGERFYSPTWRIWLNRDPIGVRGGFNLYGFCGNNALNRYDIDGRAVRIVQNGREITVTVNITIYYAHRLELNARTDLSRIARRIKKQIEDKWNAQTWQYGCCTVKFKANVKYRNQVGKNGITDDNLIAISTDPKLRSEVYGIGGNTGYWNADNRPGSDWRYAHEAGHLMGLDDDYTDVGGPNPGHAGHMMGEDRGVVVQHEVDDIMRANNVRCN